ncbi:hypothetical protein D8T49_13040 [Vibrio vulnificus]|nr:hypothetical protein [Vibrio vulnificus]EGQ9329306.1 hypothetical protein [Vibrio vulnificus]EGQ9783253.1 hypothetical protein [Vibrio vulnificus]POF48118.1 hypothetical protein CRN51_14905 [Vibrio vulnificus]RZQ03931.1 hypothetical protein D8T37_12080 [Vibrio vulnificus]
MFSYLPPKWDQVNHTCSYIRAEKGLQTREGRDVIGVSKLGSEYRFPRARSMYSQFENQCWKKTRVFLLCYKKNIIFIWIGCGMRFALVVKMRDERDEE